MYILNLDKKPLVCSNDLSKLMDGALEFVGRHYDFCNTNSCTMSEWQGRNSYSLSATVIIDGYTHSGGKVFGKLDNPSILSIIKVDEV